MTKTMTSGFALFAGASAARLFVIPGDGRRMPGFPQIVLEAPGGAAGTEIKALLTKVDDITGKLKEIADKALAEAQRGIKMSEASKVEADEKLSAVNLAKDELKQRMTDLEQKIARPGGAQAEERKSLGELVVESDEAKSLMGGGDGTKRGTIHKKIETKTITSGTASWGATASVGNSLVTPTRAEAVALQMRQLTIRDILAPGQTNANAVEYAIQVARTNAAAFVAETTAKPYSNYTWDLRSFPVRTLAHLVKASRQILDDAPALRSLIDAEMEYGLRFAEDVAFLYGDGTGANILGMVPQATAYSAAYTVDGETAIDRLRMAMLQGVLALFPMTAHVLNPTDWARIEMIKDGMGRYLIGNPQGSIQPTLWNLPVVESLALTAGTFLTGAFKYAVQIFDRMAIEIMMSTENVDDFEKNMISIRAEERLALVVKRPGALITGTLP